MFSFQNNKLFLDNNERKFEYDIRQVIEYNDYYFILLNIPFDKEEINNIFCIDNNNNLLWQSEDLNVIFPNLKNLPYEQMGIMDNILYATDFYGRNYQINIADGKIGKCTIVK